MCKIIKCDPLNREVDAMIFSPLRASYIKKDVTAIFKKEFSYYRRHINSDIEDLPVMGIAKHLKAKLAIFIDRCNPFKGVCESSSFESYCAGLDLAAKYKCQTVDIVLMKADSYEVELNDALLAAKLIMKDHPYMDVNILTNETQER